MEEFTTNPEFATCPQCIGLGQVAEIRTWTETASEHGCNGDEERCNEVCPIAVPYEQSEHYLETCQICEGAGRVPYAEMMAYVLSNTLMSPLDKSQLIEDCIEGAK